MARITDQKSESTEKQGENQPSPNTPEILLASNRELQRRIFDFHTILELSRNLNAVLDLKALLNSFLNVLLSQIQVKKAAVFQRQSRQTKKFILTNWLDIEKSPPRSLLEENSEIVKQLSSRMVAISTTELLPSISDRYEKSFLENFEPGLVVPLHIRWGMIGILIVGPKSDQTEFSGEDIEFLSLLSGQMAVANHRRKHAG